MHRVSGIFLIAAAFILTNGCDVSFNSGKVSTQRAAVAKRSAKPSEGDADSQKMGTSDSYQTNGRTTDQQTQPESNGLPTLAESRRNFKTNITKTSPSEGAPDDPRGSPFDLLTYKSPVGNLSAYLTKDPEDGKRRPAIVWITGGDCNTIGNVWEYFARSNDQSASAFRKAGIVMMFPSMRGGNNNPGQREGFYGEVDDILAATDYLEKLSYVDPERIYLGGHSTGGTLVMLTGEMTDRYRGIIALGPVGEIASYRGNFVYCNLYDREEMRLRSPLHWLHCVKSPMFVIEGAGGNSDDIIEMRSKNENPNIKFFVAQRFSHFSVIAPIAEVFSKQIANNEEINLTQEMIDEMR